MIGIEFFDSVSLTGTTPREIGLLTALQSLWFMDNPLLAGTIPFEIGLLTDMAYLEISS